ncbi:RNA polymerase sigma factor SigX [Chryseobacterium gleum]|uniref:RNA polymerase sigma factor SigX n=2 Tax=Chryseobacterium gleum TaxID=250 RepID=A0A3S4NRD7_CHRGE|nr:sigma-70 family RNA polymerase sigma factor [Chryseobacterium gleum]EFK35154.1 Sigma-70 region 2 [Chryseobacterium gleum ATCC 35910]QQY30950.1 sigma-70 family RNA polymerase sigma factor [Chryseobacterium gleum]VEE04685.1 RNA polymerase sigma factor SigX [Chryseobacterium gleum]
MVNPNEITPHLFRTEYSKIVAVLCRSFDIRHIEIAEDIAGETFLKASEYWALNGLPDNPSAWLYTVAKNKAKDYFKHLSVVEKNKQEEIKAVENNYQTIDFDTKNISDSQLEMIFAACNPVNSQETQICLALQILCGFSVEEIANAFLSKPETIKKRLQRGRETLRTHHFTIDYLNEQDIHQRLETVLTTLYLLFNEGYFSRSHNLLIRKDLCLEAMRLTLILTDHSFTNTPKANALLALMCFQSSRLDARVNDKGEAILFDEQDETLWDKALIDKGNYYLIEACQSNNSSVSKYHLEAGIAYWHTSSAEDKWQQILNLYNQLVVIEYSPVTALNQTFAFSKVYGNQKAIIEAEKLNLITSEYYHGLLGYLYAELNTNKAIYHYQEAIRLTKSNPEKQTLQKQIDLLCSK